MNTTRTIKFLNIDFYNTAYEEFLNSFEKGALYTCNIDHLVQLQSNREFYKAYSNAEYVVVDSQVLFFLLKILQKPIQAKIAGADFFYDFCKHNKNNHNISVFLFGGYDDTAEIVKEKLTNITRTDFVAGIFPTFQGFQIDDGINNRVIDSINKSRATVLAVGLGAPLQEIWIHKNRNKLPNIKIFFALGGTFDVIAGKKQRAPLVMQKAGLEWLFRLLQEPGRLYKRYLIIDLKIFYYFVIYLLGLYSNPFKKN